MSTAILEDNKVGAVDTRNVKTLKILILSPWDNVWVKYMKKYFEGKGHIFVHKKKLDYHDVAASDVTICGWADQFAGYLSALPKLTNKYICFLRSYEYYVGAYKKVNWSSFDKCIFVNSYIKDKFDGAQKIGNVDTMLMKNGIDLGEFKFNNRVSNKDVLFLAQINYKKGIDLLAQVALKLKDYTFHIAGDKQGLGDTRFVEYLETIDNVVMHGHVSDKQELFDKCSFILSTSPVEGNPNNIIEGMAVGLKPVVHRYLGYKDQFPESCCFDTVDEAFDIITRGAYMPESYRGWVEEHYDMNKVYKELEELCKV